jgi:hypothetical protein
MTGAEQRRVVYQIVTTLSAPLSSPAGAVETTFEESLRYELQRRAGSWMQIEKVRIVSMTVREPKGVVERVPGRDQISPHPFDGVLAGTPDRPCNTCGLPDRDPIHMEAVRDRRIT